MLFETHESNRSALGTAFAGSGGHAWTQVRLDRFAPYFMSVVTANEQYLAETWLLAGVEDLVAFHSALKLHFPKRSVSTYLTSPSHVNKRTQWLIEPLAEVWEGNFCAQSDVAFRYVLVDGRVYFYGAIDRGELPLSDGMCWVRRF